MKTSKEKYTRLTPRLMLQLAAPHTWAASVLPAVFGVYYGLIFIPDYAGHKAGLLVLCCIFFQSAVNVFNDYFDYKKGADTADDNVEKNDSVLVYNHVNIKHVLAYAVSLLLLAVALGCISAIGAGFAPYAVGILGTLIVYIYSGSPLPLSYLPIGELVSGFVMGGLIPLGIVACFDGRLHPDLLALSLPFIIGIGLIMMSNNGCDIEKDIRVHRHTLPILLGRERTLLLYRLLITLWIGAALAVSFFLAEKKGVCICALGILFGSRLVWRQLKLRLEPDKRVAQMKGILVCNYVINGMLILSLTARLF